MILQVGVRYSEVNLASETKWVSVEQYIRPKSGEIVKFVGGDQLLG